MSKQSVLLFVVLVLIVLVASIIRPGFFGGVSAQPTENIYLPLIMKALQALQGANGTLFVFPSSSTTNGDAGGRSGMAAICEATDAESNPCTIEEIENAWIETGVKFAPFAGEIWVDNAKLGTLVSFYDTPPGSEWAGSSSPGPRNCNGWTSTSGTGFGLTLASNGQDINLEYCDANIAVACCKRSP